MDTLHTAIFVQAFGYFVLGLLLFVVDGPKYHYTDIRLASYLLLVVGGFRMLPMQCAERDILLAHSYAGEILALVREACETGNRRWLVVVVWDIMIVCWIYLQP
jgi:hypothetical protein